jgi:hypothetical protein
MLIFKHGSERQMQSSKQMPMVWVEPASSRRAVEKEPHGHLLWFANGRGGESAVCDLRGVPIVAG